MTERRIWIAMTLAASARISVVDVPHVGVLAAPFSENDKALLGPCCMAKAPLLS